MEGLVASLTVSVETYMQSQSESEDWERHSMAIVGYGIVTLRADDVNLNLTLYMGYWKCLRQNGNYGLP